ncbi:MAG: Gar1/Naf1 family protein [Methanobrevibacter sp.]|nr:Gar1/Naf1 family protein [Candidatus Methanoflexus mossambicus]
MKFLGTFLHISNSGKLIARSNTTPSSGSFVYNKDKKKIGKLASIFGPTKKPFISVYLFKSTDKSQFNQNDDLYVSLNDKRKRRDKYGKKKKKKAKN